MEPTWTPMASARKPAPPMRRSAGPSRPRAQVAPSCRTAGLVGTARQADAGAPARLPAVSAWHRCRVSACRREGVACRRGRQGAAGRSGSRTLGPAGRARSPPCCVPPRGAEEPGPGTGGGPVPWRPGCPRVLAVAHAGRVLRAADVDAVAVPDDGSAGVAFADAEQIAGQGIVPRTPASAELSALHGVASIEVIKCRCAPGPHPSTASDRSA